MIDAYSYIRFSSHVQTLGDSLRRQTQAATEYAQKHGLNLREDLTYRDLGVSGYDRSNIEKGALFLFLSAVKEGKVKRGSVLLVENLDRLTRASTYRAVALLAELIEGGIKVVTLSDGMEYTERSLQDDRDLFYSVMLFARGHNESRRKSELGLKLYEGKRRRGAKIICTVGPGWLDKDKINERWIINDEKSASVLKIFNKFIDGTSLHRICNIANKEKWVIPSMQAKEGSTWHVSLISRIVKNIAVTGVYIEGNKAEHKDFFPRLISDEMFAQAQIIREGNLKFPRKRDQEHYNIFQGFIYCGYCGGVMGYRNHGAKRETHRCEHRRYFCNNHIRGATTNCIGRPGAKNTQENLIREIFKLLSLKITNDEYVADLQKKLESYKDLRDDLKKRENNIINMIELSSDSREQLASRLKSIKYDLSEVQEKIRKLEIDLSEVVIGDSEIDSIYESVAEALEDFNSGPEGRDRLRVKIKRYVKRVLLYSREGVAYIYVAGENTPYLVIASDKGNIIRFDENGNASAFKPAIPILK